MNTDIISHPTDIISHLIHYGQQDTTPVGYTHRGTVTWELIIDEAGTPMLLVQHKDGAYAPLLPLTPRSGGEHPAWGPDRPDYVLGLGEPREGKRTAARHASYQDMLARLIAEDVPSTPAVLACCQRTWTAADLTRLSNGAWQEMKKGAWAEPIAIQVVGATYPWWLHPVVMDGWETEYRDGHNGLEGVCPYCERMGALARLIPGCECFGGAKLVSFNCSAWEGYGRKQGANAPICLDCGVAMSRGLDTLSEHAPSFRDYPSRRGTLIWHNDDLGGLPPWGVLARIFDSNITATPRLADEVASMPPGTIISLTRSEQRLQLRHVYATDLTGFAARIERWMLFFRRANPTTVAQALCPRGERKAAENLWLAALEAIYLHLAAGVPIPEQWNTHARTVQAQEQPNAPGWLQRRRGAFYHYLEADKAMMTVEQARALAAQDSDEVFTEPDPDEWRAPLVELADAGRVGEGAAYLTGRAFARACYVQAAEHRVLTGPGLGALAESFARRSSADTALLVERHANWRPRRDGGPRRATQDGRARRFINHASDLLGSDYGAVFSREQAAQFLRGHYAERNYTFRCSAFKYGAKSGEEGVEDDDRDDDSNNEDTEGATE